MNTTATCCAGCNRVFVGHGYEVARQDVYCPFCVVPVAVGEVSTPPLFA